MTLTNDYTGNTRRAESVLTDALETWKNGLSTLTTPFKAVPTTPTLPQFDVAEALERQVKFIQQVIDINVEYARQLASATDTVTGAVRQHIEGLNTVALEQVQSVSEVTQSSVEVLEESVRETADQAEQAQREAREQAEQAEREQREQAEKAEREQREQAAKAEREERQRVARVEREKREQAEQAEREKRQEAQKAEREKRQQVREHYRSMNKNELSLEAAKRNLPKSGTVDELVDRLVKDVTSK
jgi:phage-related minor tail protein